MRTYGLRRNYNIIEDAKTKYDGWHHSKSKTAWKKLLHRRERRNTRYECKLICQY